MGFTRVGCIQGKAPSPAGYASSPVKTYVVQKEWEKPVDIAKQFGVDVLDIEFLNIPVWGVSFKKNVWLKKGTEVFVPLTNEKDMKDIKNTQIKWYTAKEDETPRGIALKHKVKYADFLAANQRRYPELVGNSRLKSGTKIQVSRFDIDDSDYMPYPHWTFPDDELDEETNEPSYMMALKLNRKFGKAADKMPIEDSLAVKIHPYSPEACGAKDVLVEPKVSEINVSNTPKNIPKEPKKPKRPPTPFLLFSTNVRTTNKAKLAGKSFVDSNKMISEMWKNMSNEEKSPFYNQFEESKSAYAKSLLQYEQELATFRLNNPLLSGPVSGVDTSLLEQVVKLKSTDGIPGYATKYQYFYVLTYIPDLLWVHLIPMRKVGVFGDKHPASAGRPIWMIVSEEEGKEFDTSASICKVVSSRTINNSADADEEQWDIYESGDKPPLAPIFALKKSEQGLKSVAMINSSATVSSSAEMHKNPKANRHKATQTLTSSKLQKKKTATRDTSDPKDAAKTPRAGSNQLQVAASVTTSKSKSKKRKFTPGKTAKNIPTRWPKRSALAKTGESEISSIAQKVSTGLCTVKVRLLGCIHECEQSLENADLAKSETYSYNVVSPALLESIKSGKFTLKVKVAGEIIVESPIGEHEAKPATTTQCKLAPIFMKKYTRQTERKSNASSGTRRHHLQRKERSPLCIHKKLSRSSPRRSPRGDQRNCKMHEKHDSIAAVVSDDGLSESSQEHCMHRRKRTRVR